MSHLRKEGMIRPFYDEADDFLVEEAEHREKVLAVLHELVGGERHARKAFDIDLVAIRSGLPRDAVLAVIPTLHNFRFMADFQGKDEVWFDPDYEGEHSWHDPGVVLQNAPVGRFRPVGGDPERWGDDVIPVFPSQRL